MATTIGVNVVEVDGTGAPAVVGAAVGTGAFNVATERGVPDDPAKVTSFAQYTERFGGFTNDALGAYMVKGFFDNGGQIAWINRVVAAAATPATVTLDPLRLRAGFRGKVDPGEWGGQLAARVTPTSSFEARFLETAPATVTGDALAATTDMTNAPALSVFVDGEAAATTISFPASDFAKVAEATRAEIRDAINRRQAKVIASLTADGKLVLVSAGQTARVKRTFTALKLTAANDTLKLAAANVTGTPAVPTPTSARLSSLDGLRPGSVLRLSDGAKTGTAKVSAVSATTNSVTWTLANAGDFNPINTVLTTPEFQLEIARGDSVVETFAGLTMEPELPSYAPSVINDPLQGSKLVVADDHGGTPHATELTPLTPGTSGLPTAVDFVNGFSAFDPRDVQLVCCERTDPAVVIAGLAYCENRGDCMYIGSVPERFVAAEEAIDYGKAFQGAKVYGALYGPQISVLDPLGAGPAPTRTIPATGHVMGVYARIASARGVWKAPAGDEARILGALDVETQLSDVDHTELVKQGSVNGIRAIPGAGICIDASRTLSTDTRWLYVNVRLLFNFVKSSLRTGLRFARQEPNRDSLWTSVKFGAVTPFLMALWRQGAFGTGSPEETFTVIVDETNNPPDQVEQGILKVEVYFYPSRPAETIVIIVGQQPSGGSAAEA
jgi:phage tail sheath protein FI